MANSREEALDRRARRLIQATESAVRRHLAIPRLEPGLVSELYLRAREVLSRARPGATAAELVEDASMALYLAVLTHEEATQPGLRTALRRVLSEALCGRPARTPTARDRRERA